MENLIVYVDDGDYALHQITPMLVPNQPIRCVLVACPPKLNRHTSKWVTKAALRRWRTDWAEKTLLPLKQVLVGQGQKVTTRVALDSLVDLTEALKVEFGSARILDARRPKLGQDQEPVTADQTKSDHSGWNLSSGVAVAGSMILLTAD